jgi:hypothetical protein
MSEEKSVKLADKAAQEAIQRQKESLWFGEVVSELLLHAQEDFRFVKVARNDDGSWFAIVGASLSDGTPVVCLAYGDSLRSTLDKLRQRCDGASWQEDKYAQDGGGGAARFSFG